MNRIIESFQRGHGLIIFLLQQEKYIVYTATRPDRTLTAALLIIENRNETKSSNSVFRNRSKTNGKWSKNLFFLLRLWCTAHVRMKMHRYPACVSRDQEDLSASLLNVQQLEEKGWEVLPECKYQSIAYRRASRHLIKIPPKTFRNLTRFVCLKWWRRMVNS
jgi:hypothetical protein